MQWLLPWTLLVILGLINNSVLVDALSSSIESDQILRNLLQNYNGDIRPNGANGTGATEVLVNFYLRSIDALDTEKMIWKIQITFRMQWQDSRLAYDDNTDGIRLLTVPLSLRPRLWKPDAFFSNEKELHTHTALEPNEYYRIFPNGEILYSTRLSMTLSCPMILKMFPHDKQECSMRIASYGYTSDDIILRWKAFDPVQVTSDLHIAKFGLEQFTTDYCNSQTKTGIYSCLRLDLLFRREFSRVLFDMYLPLVASVVLAWLSFWMDPFKSAIPRVIILTLSFVYAKSIEPGSLKEISQISYLTMWDTWITGCNTFIIVAIIEFVVVTYLVNGYDAQGIVNESLTKSKGDEGVEEAAEIDLENDGPDTKNQKGCFHKLQNVYRNANTNGRPIVIDVGTRIVYPIAFFVFILYYRAQL